jgi:glucokinase
MMTEPLVIVADIGGTNTRVALADGRSVRPESVRKFRNAEATGIGDVLTRFMAEMGVSDVDGCCVAAAGPVQNGVATMTNLDWIIDGAELARATKAEKVAILNDLQAQGHALGHIAADHLRTLVDGPAIDGTAMLVVGLGTGVNAAPVHPLPHGRLVAPSECGHIGMPITGDEDLALAKFVAHHGPHAHGFTGAEDVLAGRGIEHVFAFAAHQAGQELSRSSSEVMAEITAGTALGQTTARIYTRVLASYLGDLALIHMPYGGIFLIGGMARAMTPFFAECGLEKAFRAKGRFSDFLENFRISVVEDDFAALTGCAAHLAE